MIGTVLGNRYEIVEKVGMGGMAVVYKAMDKLLNRYVAVKLLRSEFEGNEEFIRRFNIESQAAASLSHPNIVPIYDVGESKNLQYIVMEYLEGKTLKQYITEKKGHIYWKEAADISMQICSALEHAHSKHIIHRDIKPQNIMITKDGIVKVMDFGIARAANNVTTTMEAVGSAHYLSPEQARGGYTDQRSDIYSLGVLMYELFTGELPFDGESPVAVAMQHMQSEPRRPRSLNPDIPQPIEDIILKAMSKEQRLRYDSAANMLLDLKRAYADPDSDVVAKRLVNDDEKFGTRVMPPIVNIDMPLKEEKVTQKPLVRRSSEEEPPVRKTVPKKGGKKADTVAVAVGIVTVLIMAVIVGVIAFMMLGGPREEKEGEYTVPNLINYSLDQVKNELEDSEFGYSIAVQEFNADVPKDHVISQDPLPQEVLDKPCEIKLTVSMGAATFRLSDYTGEEGEEVQKLLEGADYALSVSIIQEDNEEIPEGRIIRHLPSAGAEMKSGDKIKLYVSKGADEDMAEVPPLSGLDENTAKTTIERNGFKVGEVIPIQSESKKGLVVDQSIVSGTMEKRGTEIDIYVSAGDGSEPQGNGNAPQEKPETPQGGNHGSEGEGGNNQPNNKPEANAPQTSDNGL